MMKCRVNQGVVRKGLFVSALLMGVFGLGQVASFGQTYNVDPPDPGQTIEIEDGEGSIKVTRISSCKNLRRWKVVCKSCEGSSTGTATGGSQGGMLDVSCDTQSSNSLSYVDNLTFNYHHFAADYRVGKGSAGCSSCATGVSGGGAGLMELLIERRHRTRSMTEYGSFGPGVYSNFDTKIFLNEPEGAGNGIQLDVFDPRENWKLRLVDGLEGDTLDGVLMDVESMSVKEARLLNSTDVVTSDLNTAVTVEVESHSGQVTRFEIIDLAGDAVSDEELIGQWKFDETSGSTATDSSGEGHDGTIIGATRITSSGAPVPGGAGGALSFDGVDDYINLGDPSGLDITGEVTLAAWVKIGATDGYRNIIGHGLGLNPHGELFLRINDGEYEVGSWKGRFYRATAPIPAEDTANGGQWVHLAGVYDGATWRLYRNGLLIGASQKGTGSVVNQENWAIGARGTGTTRYFDGEIDEVRVYSRRVLEGDIAQLAQQKILAGRLVSITDRNGYSTDVAYKSFTTTQLDESPERQWQMDTVTDPYGRQATFTYKSAQVAGQWVVESIDLPNGEDVDYIYGDGVHLTQVDHADGTISTFTYTADSATQTVKVAINDASADGKHRNKTAYLTNQIFLNEGLDLEYAEIYNQSAMMIRMLANGTGEVAYLNISDPNHSSNNVNLIYEGGGSLRRIQAGGQSLHYKSGWTLGDPALGYDAVSGSLENTGNTIYGLGFAVDSYYRLGNWPKSKDKAGRTYGYTYDSDTFITSKQYFTGSTMESEETYEYNGFKQMTKYVDRLGRETQYTYDTNGNLLTRKVGILNGVDQPEVATYTNTYYGVSEGPAYSGITGAATSQPVSLLKSSADANGNTTHYVYDDDNFLIATIQPADRAGDARAVVRYEYDTADRLSKVIDPLLRETAFTYDDRNRQKVVTYEDDSTEEIFYANELSGGAGNQANLVVAMKDRNDNYTQYRYDGHGRRVTTIRGITTESDALNQSFIPDTTYHDVEECVYLEGTNLKTRCTRNGERTDYVYDFRQRRVATIVYPRDEGTFPYNTNLVDPDGTAGPLAAGDDPGRLVTVNRYDRNLRIASIDSFGRATFHYYRSADAALVRTIKETVPGGSGIDFETGTYGTIINLNRDLSYEDAATLGTTTSGGGAGYLITDMVKDSEGQTTSMVDPRNIQHDTVFDSRGRAIESITAVGTTVEAETGTVYDANSNVITSRSARYFDSGDTEGFNKAYTTMTYTGRNMLATQTVAAGDSTYDTFVTSSGATGLGAKATQEMFYYLDGRHEKTVDFKGSDPQFTAADHTTLSVWRACCERIRATIDPDGHGKAQGTDYNGNVAHTAIVDSLINDVVVDGTTGARTIADSDFDGIPGYWDAPDARTLAETTTRFDSKNRPVASTVWLEKLDKVDPNDPPILYGSSIQGSTRAQSAATGLGAGDGLTTLYYYSEDIYETPVVSVGIEGVPSRGPSQGNTILVHQFSGAPDIDLQPMLNELSADSIEVLRDDYTNASAMATINPEGEISVTIMDGVGRAVISAMLDPTNNSVVTWSTASHDRVSDAIATTFGDTVETLSISALDHLNRSFTDGVGRTIEAEDAEGEISYAIYNNAGNAIRTRSANAVGQDCDFDARGRDISCEDTQGDTITRTYNDNNQVLTVTDAKGVANKAATVYDARGRAIETTSRLSTLDTNKAAYDPNSNLLMQTDAQGGVTTYEYNPRNLRIATLMPGHNTLSVVGDSDYDRAEMTYDAMRRPLLKTDQLGDTCVYTYDLASRLLTRDYREVGDSTPLTNGLPTGSIEDTDTFTYDDASRPLTATKGRYANTVTFAYDSIGRPTSEMMSITIGGHTKDFTTGYTNYDDDSRLTVLTYPDGSTVTTSFTDRNQAEDIDYKPSGGTTTTIATMSYDAGMRHTSAALGNGLTPTYAYREDTTADTRDNMLESITVTGKAGLTLDYTYDANKNMTAEDMGGVMDDFGVDLVQDAKDRMTTWTRDTTNTALDSQSWNLSFESDWTDSTLTDGGTGTTQTRTHSSAHELLTLDPDGAGSASAETYTHDAKGNLATDPMHGSGHGRAYDYDFDNHLYHIKTPGTSVVHADYKYDALGRRVSKKISGHYTLFVHAGQQVLAEYLETGGSSPSLERKYVFCATGYIDEPIAMIDASGSSEDTYYYHRNRQFSIIGLTDDTGTVIERYAYSAYGELTVLDANGAADLDNKSDVGNPFTYTGRRYDDESGLYYYRARLYDPGTGRFLQRDPLGYPDGLNTYAAYHVMRGGVDPMGLYATDSIPYEDYPEDDEEDCPETTITSSGCRDGDCRVTKADYEIVGYLVRAETGAGTEVMDMLKDSKSDVGGSLKRARKAVGHVAKRNGIKTHWHKARNVGANAAKFMLYSIELGFMYEVEYEYQVCKGGKWQNPKSVEIDEVFDYWAKPIINRRSIPGPRSDDGFLLNDKDDRAKLIRAIEATIPKLKNNARTVNRDLASAAWREARKHSGCR